MPPKAKPTTTAKTIQKRSARRPSAAAAVKAATASLLPRRRRENESIVPPQAPARSLSPTETEINIGDGGERISALELQNQALIDSIDEVKERYDELMTVLTSIRADIHENTRGPPVVEPPITIHGMTPAEAIQHSMPWVDASTLANVVSCTLDVAHFIKLIPPEQRPKGQVNFGLPTGMHIDSATGKTSFVNESTVTYEKAFPDYSTLMSALSVYLAIRALYDTDNLGFGYAIGMYIRQLAVWSKHHRWPAIVAYFIAHFRKHQPSADPRVWVDVDLQLFAMYVMNDTTRSVGGNTNQRESGPLASSSEICHNWNKEKGCHWQKCVRKHICMQCAGDHPGFRCTSKPKPSSS